MASIDFLPETYRQQSVQRRTNIWRLAVTALFCLVIGAATLGQARIRRALEADLELVRAEHAQALAQTARLSDLQPQLRRERARAELYTWLRHPWPRTQVLAALVAPLSSPIMLQRIQLGRETPAVARPSVFPPAGPSKASSGVPADVPAAERDLEQLRLQFDSLPVVVSIEGTAREATALHVYLGCLAATELFAKVELLSLQQEPDSGTYGFRARLTLRPGYGQPQGPPPAAVASAGAIATAASAPGGEP